MPSFLEQLGEEEARCWVQAHVAGSACSGVLIRAHLIPAQRIRRNTITLRSSIGRRWPVTVPEKAELDRIVWDRRVWVPMCGGVTGIGGHHGMVDARQLRIERAWIPAAVEEFAEEYGLGWSLEADYGPKEVADGR